MAIYDILVAGQIIHDTNQWRIEDFSHRRKAPTQKGEARQPLFGQIFVENCMNLKLDRGESTSLPPFPHWILQCLYILNWKKKTTTETKIENAVWNVNYYQVKLSMKLIHKWLVCNKAFIAGGNTMKMNEVTCDKRKMLIKLQNTKLCLCPGWEGQLVYCYHALYIQTHWGALIRHN